MTVYFWLWTLYFVPLVDLSRLETIPFCFNYHSFIISLRLVVLRKCFSFFKIIFVIRVRLPFPVHFKISLSISTKTWLLIGMVFHFLSDLTPSNAGCLGISLCCQTAVFLRTAFVVVLDRKAV